VIANYHMQIYIKFLKSFKKILTKICSGLIGNVFTPVHNITHMNTGCYIIFFQVRKKYIIIEFEKEFTEVLIIISSTKMGICNNRNLQRSSPKTTTFSTSSSIKVSKPFFFFASSDFVLYTASSGTITLGSKPLTL